MDCLWGGACGRFRQQTLLRQINGFFAKCGLFFAKWGLFFANFLCPHIIEDMNNRFFINTRLGIRLFF